MELLLFLLVLSVGAALEVFHEELYVRRVEEATIFHFQFTTRWKQQSEFQWQHYNLFPKSLGQTVESIGLEELHLSFSKGDWKYDTWGSPFVSAPSGVEIWGSLNSDPVNSEYGQEDAWTRATRQLSGMFCASLNQLDDLKASEPTTSFNWEKDSSLLFKYGQLPEEVSCTENLTPWKKLLPSRSSSGLSSLLVPKRLFGALHHTMATHFKKTCDDSSEERARGSKWSDCSAKVAELIQEFTVVFAGGEANPLLQLVGAGNSKVTEFPQSPIASSSTVFIEVSGDQPHVSESGIDCFVVPTPTDEKLNLCAIDLKVTNLSGGKLVALSSGELLSSTKAPMKIERAAYGAGQLYGGVSTLIAGDLSNFKTPVLKIMETVPSYLRLRPSKLVLSTSGPNADSLQISHNHQFSTFYGSPAVIEYEIEMDVPGVINVTLAYEFDKAFQRIDDFPPDANRGFDVPALVVVLQGNDTVEALPKYSPLLQRLQFRSGAESRMYSRLLVLSMPLPDFSMPFNVITLSCTIIAIFFGNVVNSLARRRNKKKESESLFNKLTSRIKAILGRTKSQ